MRELQHVIEHAVITADGGRLTFDLPASTRAVPIAPAAEPIPTVNSERIMTDAQMRHLEAENIRTALRMAKGKVSGPGGAAELLGVRPTTLALSPHDSNLSALLMTTAGHDILHHAS